MGCRILVGTEGGRSELHDDAVLYCSTTGIAFGPVFHGRDERDLDAHEMADLFIEFTGKQVGGNWRDPRAIPNDLIIDVTYNVFCKWLDALPKETRGLDALKEALNT